MLGELDQAIVTAVEEDHPVTLRGVYYRVVSAGAVDKTEAAYDRVGRQLLKLRRSGTIPYDRITDGTRWVTRLRAYDDVDQAVEEMAASYRRRLWNDQRVAVSMFTEKDAISGVVEPVTRGWDVPLGVMRGYGSESFAYRIGEEVRANRCPVFVYQLGDHDPSGVDAWRDFTRKVLEFVGNRPAGCPVRFERLAVTPEQIETWQLPTRPTKPTDSRTARWSGGGSVEVDAIPAPKLRELVEQAITQHIDQEALRLTRVAERSERAGLLAWKGRLNTAGSGYFTDPAGFLFDQPDLNGGAA